MALVLNRPLSGPQIHAFIIGIGEYPYLKGGNREVPQLLDGISELKQLTSPPLSAVAFCNLLRTLDDDSNLAFPLGSIEFFGSEVPNSGGIPPDLISEPPTRANLGQAYDHWLNRCQAHSENVAIFFFCGHGVEDGDQFLLTHDFGQRSTSPFDGSFNFDETKIAVNQANIKHQLFFVDACRDILPGMLEFSVKPAPLSPPSKILGSCKYYLTLKAAAPNEGAFALPNNVSFFTSALIKALTGEIARKKDGKWVVTTSKLLEQISELMERENIGQGDPIRCLKDTDSSFTIAIWPNPTNRTLTISCDPNAALHSADLFCKQLDGTTDLTRGPALDSWEIKIPAGLYEIKATFATNNYLEKFRLINIEDPYNFETLCCL